MATLRKGFLVTNGSGCYIVNREQRNDMDTLIKQGWKIGAIRPICTSMMVKIKHLPPEILKQRVYSYSLCILELQLTDGMAPPPEFESDPLTDELA